MGKWIEFKEDDPAPGKARKTKLWHIVSKARGNIIGEIRWYPGWHRYALHPNPNTVWDEVCMREISDFCAARTAEQKGTGAPEARAARNWLNDLIQLYETPEAVCAWLSASHPQLNNCSAINVVLGTKHGSEDVARIVDQLASGAFI